MGERTEVSCSRVFWSERLTGCLSLSLSLSLSARRWNDRVSACREPDGWLFTYIHISRPFCVARALCEFAYANKTCNAFDFVSECVCV